MKTHLFIGFIAVLIWACSPAKETVKTSAMLTHSSQDSTEYDIVIIDPGFDQWYIVNYSEAKDHSTEYYRSKNLIAVAQWNDYFRDGRYNRIVDSSIDYHPDVDYGIEVNRKLFWYFMYLKNNYKIRLFL